MQTTGGRVSDDSSVTVTVQHHGVQTTGKHVSDDSRVTVTVQHHGVQTTGGRVSDDSSVTVTVYLWSTMECRQLVNMSVMTAVSQ